MLAEDREPILLFETGCADFLPEVKKNHSTGPLQQGDKIIWCRTVILHSTVHVLYTAKTRVGSLWFGKNNLWPYIFKLYICIVLLNPYNN